MISTNEIVRQYVKKFKNTFLELLHPGHNNLEVLARERLTGAQLLPDLAKFTVVYGSLMLIFGVAVGVDEHGVHVRSYVELNN